MGIVIAREAPAPSATDSALEVISKLIPVEVVTIYTTANSFDGVGTSKYAAPVLLVVGIALTPLILFFSSRPSSKRPTIAQYAVRTLAFVAWAFAIGNPLAPHRPIEHWIGGLAVLVIPVLGSFLFPRSDA